MVVTLRHTPTAAFLSIIATLVFLGGLALIVLVRDLQAVVTGVVYLLPLPLLWRTRVVLVPGGADLVLLRRRHVPAANVRAVLLERVGQRAWTTRLELADGSRRGAVALTAMKLAPGFATRPQPGLVDLARRLSDHLGVPLRIVPPGRRPPPPPSPPPPAHPPSPQPPGR